METPLLPSSPSQAPIAPLLASGPVAGIHPSPLEARPEARFLPTEPRTLVEAELESAEVEAILLKLLLVRGTATGRVLAELLKLPRKLVLGVLEGLRAELLVAIKGSSGLDDYVFQLTDAGHERGRRLATTCAYAGAAPVSFESYVRAVQQQSLAGRRLTLAMLQKSFAHLRLGAALQSQLGQAVNDGKGLFLYGPPGNGKTSIAERVIGAYEDFLWVPRVISIDGELVRLFDPQAHQPICNEQLEKTAYDRRWVLIERPTIVVGGELTMSQLDLQVHRELGISEASVQMRANGGALVIDDFGRQRMPTSELLNRLIVPMEKQVDFLNLSSGRQTAMPFDVFLVFSTNLAPQDLVDEAFLRRIPYKIEVAGPTEAEFKNLFLELAAQSGCRCAPQAIDELLDLHYRPSQRPLRFCHPRDLLRQIRNYCEFSEKQLEVNQKTLDTAISNYFAGL